MNHKKIFITGACSFVGKSLVHFLTQNFSTTQLILCCRNREKAHVFTGDNMTVVTADLTEPETYQTLFSRFQPDYVIHLAATARFKDGESQPEKTLQTNFLASVQLLKFARETGIKKFLFVSSNLARNPAGITGYSKYLTEAFIQSTDLKPLSVVSIRLPNVIDSPGAVTLIFKKQIEEGKPITITDKRMSRKFITPEMAAEQLLFALQHGKHKDIFINNRPSTPIVELARQMIKDSGKNIPVKFIGMRPGEKLEEADYPQDTITPTAHPELFLLKEDQHKKKDVQNILDNLTGKISQESADKIKHILNFKDY